MRTDLAGFWSGPSTFANALTTGIRMLLVEEGRYICEHDLAHALATRVPNSNEEIARNAAKIAWSITWLHPLALGFFVFGLCAEQNWFPSGDNQEYVARLLRVTPSDRAREAFDLYAEYQLFERDGGAAVIRGFGIERIEEFEERVFGTATQELGS